ncbi:hypothetical protein R0131_05515 [Clostridium sp. AL.422]|uniref:hypothetical protein n=1 Tax=Clostridium TaxID=1485 RepID=UPI00293DB108|nr:MULTISPECIES: hypothetical protein [unclassified Clostridium]MDV4150285.1 hypothetical protein [Clostridium sp. AL.422]
MGWQGNLKNMHTNEVLGGIVDATKLLYADDTQTDLLKANGSLIMATELYNWIQAISNLAVNHCNQYGSQIVSVAQQFYQEECIVSQMLKINMNLLTEFVYNNYEDKDGFERIIRSIASFSRSTIQNMNARFRIKTGRKWNSFWGIYEDVFQDVYPDFNTVSARNELNSAVQTLEANFEVWKRNYTEKIATEKAKALDARRKIFWENNPSRYDLYQNKCNEMKSLCSNIEIAKKELSKAEKEYQPFQKELQDMRNMINTKNTEINRLSKKIFGKKKAEEQISVLEYEISVINEQIICVNPKRETASKEVDKCKNNLKRLEEFLSEIKKDIDQLVREAEA